MEFSRQEDWSGLPFPPPEDLLNLGIKPRSPALLETLYPLCHQRSGDLNGKEIQKEGIYVYGWLIHFGVQQKLTQP